MKLGTILGAVMRRVQGASLSWLRRRPSPPAADHVEVVRNNQSPAGKLKNRLACFLGPFPEPTALWSAASAIRPQRDHRITRVARRAGMKQEAAATKVEAGNGEVDERVERLHLEQDVF